MKEEYRSSIIRAEEEEKTTQKEIPSRDEIVSEDEM